MSNKTKITAEPGKQELFVTREFEAPPRLVFRAHSDPQYYVRWYGCESMKIAIEKFEPHSGGAYRFRQSFTGGQEFLVQGCFHQVSEQRIVRTVESSGNPGHVVMETTRFEALPERRTRLVNQMVFQSLEDRDYMVRAGVEMGSRQAHESLDVLLTEMRIREPI